MVTRCEIWGQRRCSQNTQTQETDVFLKNFFPYFADIPENFCAIAKHLKQIKFTKSN